MTKQQVALPHRVLEQMSQNTVRASSHHLQRSPCSDSIETHDPLLQQTEKIYSTKCFTNPYSNPLHSSHHPSVPSRTRETVNHNMFFFAFPCRPHLCNVEKSNFVDQIALVNHVLYVLCHPVFFCNKAQQSEPIALSPCRHATVPPYKQPGQPTHQHTHAICSRKPPKKELFLSTPMAKPKGLQSRSGPGRSHVEASGDQICFFHGDETRQVSKEIQSVTQKQRPSRETCGTRVPDHFRSRGRWTTAMGGTTFQERQRESTSTGTGQSCSTSKSMQVSRWRGVWEVPDETSS